MALNLNIAINTIKNLFQNLKGTSAFSIQIKKIEPLLGGRMESYKIELVITNLGMGGSSNRYMVTYNQSEGVVEDVVESGITL